MEEVWVRMIFNLSVNTGWGIVPFGDCRVNLQYHFVATHRHALSVMCIRQALEVQKRSIRYPLGQYVQHNQESHEQSVPSSQTERVPSTISKSAIPPTVPNQSQDVALLNPRTASLRSSAHSRVDSADQALWKRPVDHGAKSTKRPSDPPSIPIPMLW